MNEPLEFKLGLLNQSDIKKSDATLVKLNAVEPVLLGKGALVKVNTAVGVASSKDYNSEIHKLKEIINLSYRPDMITDLSVVSTSQPLYKFLLNNFKGAVGIIPYYTLFSNRNGIDSLELLERIECLLSEGVSFMTLHFTATPYLYEKALKSNRKIICTSRGGYCILHDVQKNRRLENILLENLNDILFLFRKYDATISIGSVFRPGSVHDALDEVQLEEIKFQKNLVKKCKEEKVKVILEGLGHATLNGIRKYAEIVCDCAVPLMPLGPLPSDELIGFDHIGNALGALTLAESTFMSVINSITRQEHTGDIPSTSSILEGLKTAKAVAHVINSSRFPAYRMFTEVAGEKRRLQKRCIVEGGLFEEKVQAKNCRRCERECPYNLNKTVK